MHSQNIVHPAGWTAGQAGEDVLKQSGFLNWITFPSFNSAHVTGDTAQLNSWVSSQVLNLWPLPTSGALSIAQLFSRLSASSLFSLQCIYQFYPSLKVALLKRLLTIYLFSACAHISIFLCWACTPQETRGYLIPDSSSYKCLTKAQLDGMSNWLCYQHPPKVGKYRGAVSSTAYLYWPGGHQEHSQHQGMSNEKAYG